jgi:hypothetical protein
MKKKELATIVVRGIKIGRRGRGQDADLVLTWDSVEQRNEFLRLFRREDRSEPSPSTCEASLVHKAR